MGRFGGEDRWQERRKSEIPGEFAIAQTRGGIGGRKKTMKKTILQSGLVVLLAVSGVLNAQESNPTATSSQPSSAAASVPEVRDGILVYKIEVVARDIPAINYFHRSRSTKIGFAGTALLPGLLVSQTPARMMNSTPTKRIAPFAMGS